MRGGVFATERVAAADAVERIPWMLRAWYWERDANAGPYSAEHVCLGHAGSADGLILILGKTLTQITKKEYEVAFARGVPTYILIDQRVDASARTKRFIASERRRSVTKGFANVSELESHVIQAITLFTVQSVRRVNHQTRVHRQGRGT